MTSGVVTKQWVAIHRKHHAKCETVEDPHSPQTRGIWKVLLEGAELYRAEAKVTETMEKYGHGTPDDWMERHVYGRHSVIGVALMMVINIAVFGPIGLTIWAVQMAWMPIMAAGIINGIGHYWGYRNFASEDASTNILPWGILIGGEELHNNHHAYGTSARLSNKWYEFDIGWLYIKLMSYVGLATVRKVAPTVKWQPAKPLCDLDTLQAVITHRYDVMTRFVKSVRADTAAEIAKLKAGASLPENWNLNSFRSWLYKEPDELAAADKAELDTLLGKSERLQTVYRMRQELAAVIQVAIGELPADQRTTLVLADIEGMDYQEIADTMGTALGTVKSRLSRGRARLRDFLLERGELLPARYRLRDDETTAYTEPAGGRER